MIHYFKLKPILVFLNKQYDMNVVPNDWNNEFTSNAIYGLEKENKKDIGFSQN